MSLSGKGGCVRPAVWSFAGASTAALFGFCAFPGQGVGWAEGKRSVGEVSLHVLVVVAGQAVQDSSPEQDAAERTGSCKDLLADSLGSSGC